MTPGTPGPGFVTAGLAGGCAGLLLPLPLLLLFWVLPGPETPVALPAGMRISPVLDPEQRLRLTTYQRECQSTAECEPPLGCVFDSRYRHAYCTDSQCVTDAQCAADQACRALAVKDDGPMVRMCIPLGARQEGESCDPLPKDKEHSCSDGLMCRGHNSSWCGRPCHLNATPTECPEGFFCAGTRPDPICLPTCKSRGCPTGQQCVTIEAEIAVCAKVYGTNCQESPCSEGRECWVLTKPPHPGKVWMECIEQCGKGFPPCSQGKVCDAWQCRPACDPQGPAVCAEGFRCRQPWPDSPFACNPDW